jgi:hypothetical protein
VGLRDGKEEIMNAADPLVEMGREQDEAARQRAFDAHLDALCKDMDDGKGIETTPAELMARVRARLERRLV